MMRELPAVPFPRDIRLLADALSEGPATAAALERVAGDLDLLAENRVAAAVARRAPWAPLSAEPPSLLQKRLVAGAARVALLTRTLQRVGDVLGEAGVPWAPIKGGDLAFRAYALPEDREVGDLDVLVPEHRRTEACAALEAAGRFRSHEGEPFESYLRDEGYCTQLNEPGGLLLEVHHRLWGAVPAGLSEAVLRASAPDPGLGPTGRRITDAHAFVLGACHLWTVARPRALSNWWDLQRLATEGGDGLADAVIEAAVHWELHLPVGLAALAAGSLWPGDTLAEIAHELLSRLRPPERLVVARCTRRGPGAVPYASVVLARLLARRPSRHGWLSAWRQLWPHPAIRAAQRPR